MLTSTTLRHLTHGGGGILGTLCLSLLCPHLRSIQDGKGITYPHEITFLHANLENTSRYLTGYAIFRHFHFTLNLIGFLIDGEETDQGNDYDHCYKAENGKQDVVMLLFC